MSLASPISEAERRYIALGIAQGLRTDGRAALDYRQNTVESSVLPSSNGSARVVLGGTGSGLLADGADASIGASIGGTDVLVAVSCELGEPSAAAPARGCVSCSVEVSPALAGNDGGGARDVEAELGAALEQLVFGVADGDDATACGGALDLDALCVARGRHCWHVHVDALVVASDGGALLDALSFATHVALRTCRLPRVADATDGGRRAGSGGARGGGAPLELVDGGARDRAVPLLADAAAAARVPVCVSVSRVPAAPAAPVPAAAAREAGADGGAAKRARLGAARPPGGGHLIVDASGEEEPCVAASVAVAVDSAGHVRGVRQGGGGGVPVMELGPVLSAARSVALSVLASLDAAVEAAAAAEGSVARADEPPARIGMML